MKSNKFIRLAGLTLLLALTLALVSGGLVSAQDSIKTLTSSVDITAGEPASIDPAQAQDTVQVQNINEMFPGLTVINEVSSAVEAGTATSWDISDDKMTYTFHIADNIPWVRYNPDTGAVEEVKDDAGNVRYVTAQDYVYSWVRAMDPATADPYVYVLTPLVVNGDKFNAGDASVTAADLGIKAVDDHTFEVTSPIVAAYAITIYGMYASRAVPQWAVESAGDQWATDEYINTYGPYALKEWVHNDHETFIKNPFWPGSAGVPQPKIDEVTIRFLDASTQFTEYLAGNLDAAEVPPDQLDFVRSDTTLSSQYYNGTSLCSYYYGFNETKAPFDNVHIRAAFSYAVDRQSIVDNVTKGGQTPARWFANPGLVAAPTLESNPDLGVTFDTDKAQQELQAGLADLGLASAADLPAMTLAFNQSTTHAAIAQAVQQMWSDTLGVTVQVQQREGATYFDTEREDADQIFRAGWCPDYPDTSNYDRDVFRSDSTQNYGHFNSPQFDQLVDQAVTELDNSKRQALYAQAENILSVTDVGQIPFYWYATNQIAQPWVERTYEVTGVAAYEKWDVAAH
jgi:oligopeptide transport system substrate-binding protein